MTIDTSPWSTSIPSLSTSGYVQTLQVYLDTGGVDLYALAPTSCVVTVDGARSPRWSASIVCAFPPKAVRSLLDPRAGLRVILNAGYRVGTFDDLQRLATLTVTDVVIDHVAQTITLTCRSSEALVIAYPADTAYAYSAGSSILAAVVEVVEDCFPASPALTWDTTAAGTSPTFATAQRLEVGEDRWDAVTDWLEGLGLKAWHDAQADVWVIGRPPSTPPSAASARLKVGTSGTVSALSLNRTVVGYANRACVVWEYKSSTSAATTTVTTAVASTGESPVRMVTIRRKRKPDRPKDVAERALNRAQRRGESVKAKAASFLWVRPDQAVTFALPDGDTVRMVVESVRFDLVAGTMDLTGQAPTAIVVPTITQTN